MIGDTPYDAEAGSKPERRLRAFSLAASRKRFYCRPAALPLLTICSNFCSASKAAGRDAETDQHGQPGRIPVQADGELKIEAIADGLRSRAA